MREKEEEEEEEENKKRMKKKTKKEYPKCKVSLSLTLSLSLKVSEIFAERNVKPRHVEVSLVKQPLGQGRLALLNSAWLNIVSHWGFVDVFTPDSEQEEEEKISEQEGEAKSHETIRYIGGKRTMESKEENQYVNKVYLMWVSSKDDLPK